ncbi:hypothetical protein ABGB18_35850 [Nonomuraea sp. B12E4]|uniref:hypothetical protein n=1 Tax=Nonomuraea sp. B12E4 TaxID=3153564 RepID=UPI00325CEBB2
MRTCCAREKKRKQPCCAIGKCCKDHPSRGTIESVRRVFRSAISHAIRWVMWQLSDGRTLDRLRDELENGDE